MSPPGRPPYMTPTPCLSGGVEMDNYGRPIAYHICKISTRPAMFFPVIGRDRARSGTGRNGRDHFDEMGGFFAHVVSVDGVYRD